MKLLAILAVLVLFDPFRALAALTSDLAEKKDLSETQVHALQGAEKTINGYLQAERDGNRDAAARKLAEVRKSIAELNQAQVPTKVPPFRLSDKELASYLKNLPLATVKVAGPGGTVDTMIRACVIVFAAYFYCDNSYKYPLEPLPPQRRRGVSDETFN